MKILSVRNGLSFLQKNPELSVRPIVVTMKGALIGSPSGNILKVLN